MTTLVPDSNAPVPDWARRDWAYARTLIDTKRPPVPRPYPPKGVSVCGNDRSLATQFRERDDLCFSTGDLRCFALGQYRIMTSVERYMGAVSKAGQHAGSEAKALMSAGVDIQAFLRGLVLDFDTDKPAPKQGIELSKIARYMHQSGIDFSVELSRMAADSRLDMANRMRAAKTLWFLQRKIAGRPSAEVEAAFRRAGLDFGLAWAHRAEGRLRR